MKGILMTLIAVLVFVSCNKESQQLNASECALRMFKLFENEISCTSEGTMESNLYSGIYKGETVYFPNIMCPACNTIAPSFGYTCASIRVEFEDYHSDVSDVKLVYNSCSKKFTE